MPGKYPVPKRDVDALAGEFKLIWKAINSLRSSAGLLSAIIGKGGVRVKSGGSILIEDGGGIMVGDGGFITAIGGSIRAVHETTNAAMAFFGRLLPPYRSGLMTATEDGDAFFWVAVMEDGTRVSNFDGATHRVEGTESITLNSPSLRVYGLGSTGIAPNLAMEIINGVPIIKVVGSSERLKTDIAPVEIDVNEVLEYQAITWVHNETLDSSPPGDIRRNVGHHAEAMDRFPSLRQFVNYDEDGLPASVQEGRFEVALHEVMKALWLRVNDHDARLEALENLGA